MLTGGTPSRSLATGGNKLRLVPTCTGVTMVGMDTTKGPEENGGQLFPEPHKLLTVEPLKPKRPSRTVKEVESLLAALQVGISTELSLAKHEILEHLREISTSVDLIAQELASRQH